VVGIHHTRPARERAGYEYEGHLRGLHQPAEAGFVAVAEGFSPAGIRHRVTPLIHEGLRCSVSLKTTARHR
jgi:hypothetical protein